ncbi:MAG: proton-conducting transporter membrane subunit, partial [Actinomycetota bacterium]
VVLLLALDGPGARARVEHHALLLAAVAGAVALAAARDLASLVIALETASLPVVALIALRRDARGAEAALKLLLVAVASLGVLLLGVALVYAGAGTLHLAGLSLLDPDGARRALLLLGLALVVAGAAFKLSAMPFGWWTPDVYAGSPPPVAAFLSTVSKAAATAFVVVVLVVGAPLLVADWTTLVAVLALTTMTVGNLVALRQRVAVRLLAWSTVAQAGWVLLPLAGAGAGLPAA